MKKNIKPVLLTLSFILVFFIVTIAISFMVFVFETFSMTKVVRQTDAIVVLTGGRGRVEEGIRLYRSGQSHWLLLAGVDPLVRKSDLFVDRRGESLADGILLEKISRNTMENAIYVRDLLLNRNVNSILLITSRYHMKRAHLLFRQFIRKDIRIYPYPVESRNLPGAWWSKMGSLRLLATEFYKYWLFRLFFLVTGDSSAAHSDFLIE